MMKQSALVGMVLALGLSAAVAPAAEDVHEYLAWVPEDAPAVFVVPDVPTMKKQLEASGLKAFLDDALTQGPPQQIRQAVSEFYQALSGRLVYVHYAGKAPLVLADVRPNSPFAKGIRPGGQLAGMPLKPLAPNLYDLAPQGRSAGFIFCDGKHLRCAPDRSLAADPLRAPGRKLTASEGFKATFARLDAKGGVRVYVPKPLALLPEPDDGPPQRPERAFKVLGLRFVRALLELDRFGAAALRLDIGDGIHVEQVVQMKGLTPGGEPRLAILSRVPGGSVAALAGRCRSFASACGRLRRAMKAVDKEISDEFDEELAEVNRELGFDFEKAFLTNLGREWAFTRDAKGSWALLFTVKDRETFLRHATALAKFGGEPWTPATLHGKPVFRTRAYTVPLVVAFAGDVCILSSSDDTLTACRQEPAPAATLATTKPFERAPLRGESLASVAFWRPLADPQVGKFLREEAPVALRPVMQIIPSEAVLWVRVDEGTGYRRARMGTAGLTGDHLRTIVRDVLRPALDLPGGR